MTKSPLLLGVAVDWGKELNVFISDMVWLPESVTNTPVPPVIPATILSIYSLLTKSELLLGVPVDCGRIKSFYIWYGLISCKTNISSC